MKTLIFLVAMSFIPMATYADILNVGDQVYYKIRFSNPDAIARRQTPEVVIDEAVIKVGRDLDTKQKVALLTFKDKDKDKLPQQLVSQWLPDDQSIFMSKEQVHKQYGDCVSAGGKREMIWGRTKVYTTCTDGKVWVIDNDEIPNGVFRTRYESPNGQDYAILEFVRIIPSKFVIIRE